MTASSDLGMGEKAISKAAEAAVESLLTDVQDLQVAIETDPIKLAKGEVDRLKVEGKGIVAKGELRTESLSLDAKDIDVDMLKAAAGSFELEQPAEAAAQVTLTAKDIEKAFNADYVKKKLRGEKVTLPSGDRATLDVSDMQFTFPSAGEAHLLATVMLIEKVEKSSVGFSCEPKLAQNGRKITLENVQPDEASADEEAIAHALADCIGALLDFDRFDLNNMDFQFNQLAVEPGKMMLSGSAQIESFD